MFFYEGYSCPVCGKRFGPSDDIVVCPTCGAPHHRTCWQREGHCHFEADHGTDRQWSREKYTPKATESKAASGTETRRCPNCGYPNPSFAEFCSRCGRPTGAEEWHTPQTSPPTGNSQPYSSHYGEYSPFHVAMDPYGGISPDEQIEDLTASELAAFVGPNTAYYLPRFQKMARKDSKCSWNWAAFFLTPYWLLYRKNYVSGILLLVFEIIRTTLESYIMYGVMAPYLESYSLIEATQHMMANSQMSLFLWVFMLSSFAELLLRLFFGLAGNWLYMRTAFSRIRKLKTEDVSPVSQDIAAVGGVSFGLGITAYSILLVASMMSQYMMLYL